MMRRPTPTLVSLPWLWMMQCHKEKPARTYDHQVLDPPGSYVPVQQVTTTLAVLELLLRKCLCVASYLSLHIVSGPSDPPSFWNSVFSDEEDAEGSEAERKFKECRLCHQRLGRYCVLCCGSFPICGTCIKEWFLGLDAPCAACGHVVSGWSKVYNQN